MYVVGLDRHGWGGGIEKGQPSWVGHFSGHVKVEGPLHLATHGVGLQRGSTALTARRDTLASQSPALHYASTCIL